MSTTAADVFSENSYAAPKADLRDKRITEATPDKLFSREGRLGVLSYNARLFWCVLGMIAAFAPAIFLFITYGEAAMETTMVASFVSLAIGTIGVVFFAVIMVCAAVKRLHDLDRSGWYYLIGIIPIVGSFYTLYYSLAPAKPEDNNFGAQRQPSKSDRIMGYLGIAIVVLSFIVGLADMAGVLGGASEF